MTVPTSDAVVLFGASGDLAYKKLFPALGNLVAHGALDGPVIGVHIVGSRAGELVSEAQLIYNWEALPSDVAQLVHMHPTQGEALGEAHLALAGKPLHAHN